MSAKRRYLAMVLSLLVIFCLVGFAMGLGSYTFYYGKGYSYLTNDPRACVNCHVMRTQFESWKQSSHHAIAVCNDCHTPANFFGKYAIKALNGFEHSLAFTTQNFHEPIQIKPRSLRITVENCLNCHRALWNASRVPEHSVSNKSCIHCHKAVGHSG